MATGGAPEPLIVHRGMYYTNAPSASPFVLKLETWLRMNKIEYQADTNTRRAKHPVTQKMPWVEWRGQQIPDTSIIIETLTKDLNLNPDGHLSPEELAVGRAFQKMVEEELVWCSGLWRASWSDNGRQIAEHIFGRFLSVLLFPIYRRQYLSNSWGHGIGRLDKDSVLNIARADLKAVSDYLGDKKYFMSSDVPSTVDCAVFGVLGQQLFGMPDSCFRAWMEADFPNLKAYCERMRDEFWPDWKDLCVKDQI